MAGLLSFFNIRAGEGQLVLLMILHAFLLGVTIHFTQTAAFALFLANFEAQSLPYTYIINAIIITAIISLYLRLSRQLSFATLLSLNLIFLLLMTAALYLGVAISGAGWLIFTLPTLFEVTVNLGNLEYFSLAGRLFDLRQSKRLLGTIYGGQWLAVVVGGFLTPFLVNRLGTTHLLLLSLAALGANLILLQYLARLFAPQLAGSSGTSSTGRNQEPTSWRGSRYIYLIFALVSLWWLVYFFLDNIFFARTAAQYPVESELASFLGIFYAVMAVVALSASLVFSGPILSRYGLRAALLILPVTLTLGTSLMIGLGLGAGLLFWLFWVTAGAKLLDLALGFSIDRTALNISYQPLPAQWRSQVKATAEGIFQPLAIGLAGVVLLVLLRLLGLSATHLTYILLVLVLAWLGVAIMLGREYPRMLLKALTQRRLGELELSFTDESSLASLRQALNHPHPQVVLYALHLLAQNDSQVLPETLPILLSHSTPEVRQEAMRLIQHLELTPALKRVKDTLKTDPAPSVRAAALQTLMALSPSEGLEQVYAYLDSPEPLLKIEAIVALLQHGGVEVTMVAERNLLQWATSIDPTERIYAAQVIGEVKARNLSSLLETLLQDEDLRVRRAALNAAGLAGYPQVWSQVVASLGQRQFRGAAAAALVTGGEASLPAIQAALQVDQGREVLIRLLRVCGRIKSEQVTPLLLSQLDSPDDGVRSQVVAALDRRGYQASQPEQPLLQQQIEAEHVFAIAVLTSLVDLAAAGRRIGDEPETQNGIFQALALLQQALSEQFRQTQERLLLLLSFNYDRQAILQARENLKLDSPEKRAYALEMLDLSLPGSLKAWLFPLLEELRPVQRLERLKLTLPAPSLEFDRLLAELAQGYNPWVSACALYLGGSLGRKTPLLVEVASAASRAREPLLAETATLSLARLKKQAEL
jgi:ATP:ADP antiporter, AAA family